MTLNFLYLAPTHLHTISHWPRFLILEIGTETSRPTIYSLTYSLLAAMQHFRARTLPYQSSKLKPIPTDSIPLNPISKIWVSHQVPGLPLLSATSCGQQMHKDSRWISWALRLGLGQLESERNKIWPFGWGSISKHFFLPYPHLW